MITFLSLPNDILILVLCEWVNIVDLTFLDSALCSTISRCIFLDLISCSNFVHRELASQFFNTHYFEWLILRKINLNDLFLDFRSAEEKIIVNEMGGSIFNHMRRINCFYCHLNLKLLDLLDKFGAKIARLHLSITVGSWRALCDESLWHHLIPHFTKITSLNIHKFDDINEEFMENIATRCSNLNEFNFSDPTRSIKTDVIAIILKGNPSITNLTLPWSIDTTESFEIIIPCLNIHLTRLNLRRSVAVTDAVLKNISGKCPNLLALTLGYHSNIFSEVGISTAFINWKLLREFDANGSVSFTDEMLTIIATNCPELRIIDVTGCRKITDVGVCELVSRCKFLTNIDISYISAITGVIFLCIADHCKDLVKLDVSGGSVQIPDMSIKRLLQNCTDITHLALRCACVTADILVYVVNTLSEIETVKYISLKDDNFSEENILLQRKTTRKQLCGFDFSMWAHYHSHINETAIVKAISLCPELQELCLHLIFSDGIVLRILEFCPLLTKIKLTKMSATEDLNDNISNTIMNAIAEKCIDLSYLYAYSVENDAAIVNFVEKRGALLTFLSIPNCEITDVVAKSIVQ